MQSSIDNHFLVGSYLDGNVVVKFITNKKSKDPEILQVWRCVEAVHAKLVTEAQSRIRAEII